jgi:hypothetical protein
VPVGSVKVGKSDISNVKLPFNVKVKNKQEIQLTPRHVHGFVLD